MRRPIVIAAVLLFALAGSARATVYSWHDDGGALHFSNDADDVPDGKSEGVATFTSKHPAKPPAETAAATSPSVVAASPAGVPVADPPNDYERGLDLGLRIGEQQIRAATEIARVLVDTRQATSVAEPPQVHVSVVPAPGPTFTSANPYAYADYGFPAYSPWFFGSPAFDGGGFHRHSHSSRFGQFGHGSSDGIFLGNGGFAVMPGQTIRRR